MAPPTLAIDALTVRRYDRDRFVTALFAPPPLRDDLFTLFAFNLEIARIRETVQEPLLGEIRLQWWKDSFDALWRGRPIGHPVADALAALIIRHGLPRAPFDRLLEARRFDLQDEPPPSLAQLQGYVADSAAGLGALAAQLLCGPHDESLEAARQVGQAWGLIGLLRAHAFHIKRRRLLLPADLIAAHQLDTQELLAGAAPPGLTALAKQLADLAAGHLRAARSLRRRVAAPAIPALLTARLADGYLAALRRSGYSLLDRHWSATNSRPLVLVLSSAFHRF